MLFALAAPAAAGVVMEGGFRIEGVDYEVDALNVRQAKRAGGPIPWRPIVAVEDGIRRIFVPKSRISERLPEPQIGAADLFTLPGTRRRGGRTISRLGRVKILTPFDARGQRTVRINLGRGPVKVVQSVTEMTPDAVVVRAAGYDWEFGLATETFPTDTLVAMLRTASDETKLDDRLALVSFLVRADQHRAARAELAAIRNRFPDAADRVAPLAAEVDRYQAIRIVAELRRRLRVGQPRLAAAAAARFPRDGADPEVVADFDRLLAEIDATDARVVTLRDRLAADLDDFRAAVRPFGDGPAPPLDRIEFAMAVGEIAAVLTPAALDRLGPYESFAVSGEPAARLAWALSGWAAGPAAATDDVAAAANLWLARRLAADAVAAPDDATRKILADDLDRLEGVGPDEVAAILPRLDPWEDHAATPGEVATITADTPAGPLAYEVLLPPEYDPLRPYPVLVALHPAGLDPAGIAGFWGLAGDGGEGPAQRAGHIVLAPHFAEIDDDGKQTARLAAPVPTRRVVEATLHDAAARFHLDADRLFLAGHGRAAELALDLAYARPDPWAGVVAVGVLAPETLTWIRENGSALATYWVNGELDRDARAANGDLLMQLMKKGHDVTYVEYVGRGFESYFDEVATVFDWMTLHRRPPTPTEFERRALRAVDHDFAWLALPDLTDAPVRVAYGKTIPRTATVGAKISPGNTLYLTTSERRLTLTLEPGLLDLDARVKVRRGGRTLFSGALAPDVATLVDDFADRRDRRRLRPIRLEFE